MSIIDVKISGTADYKVHIGNDLLKDSGKIIKSYHSPCRVALITDFTVGALYTTTVLDSLTSEGFEVFIYAFYAGEASKNFDTYKGIIEFLADNEITRSDLIVALGGGVVGDVVGFAAATYMRGLPYVQIPTTILAMVDSSIGGKTAIDIEAGKNLCGAFWQPLTVICSTDTLETLEKKYFEDGIAEVVKYALLGNDYILKTLKENAHGDLYLDLKPYLNSIIEESIKTKLSYVADDVYDEGKRQYLNLGHTLGHAIEHASRYAISHGHAVAIGMCLIAKASEELGYSEEGTASEVLKLVESCGLPTKAIIGPDDLYNAALSDKKRRGDNINVIIPTKIGSCKLLTVPVNDLKQFINLGVK